MTTLKLGVDARSLVVREPSGVPLAGLHMLNALRQREEIELLLFANRYHKLLDNASQDTQSLWNPLEPFVNDPNIPSKILNGAWVATGMPTMKRYVGAHDITWMPNVGYGWSRNQKTCVTVHDLSFLLIPETFSAKDRLWHRAVRARKLIRSADVVCAVSESTARNVVDQLGVSRERVVTIWHGPPSLHAQSVRPKGVQEDVPFLLFLGNIEPRKNLLQLIRAFAVAVKRYDLPHRLVLAGGMGWKSRQLRNLIESSPVKEQIVRTGYVSEAEKTWLLKRATALVYPSLYEGFGLPVLEAFAANTPVVASSVPALAEVASDAALLAHAYDHEELAFALGQITTDEELRRELIERGARRLGAFSWERSAQQLAQALVSSVKRGKVFA